MININFEQYCRANRIRLTNHQIVVAETITLENIKTMYSFIEQRATGKTFLFKQYSKFLNEDFQFIESNPYIIKT